ncbi:protein translocase subunit SecD [Candidatus Poribacteria bacterium]|nr:protein translocase subunit SecD [Candidatus Poribacteria bacterium]
MALSKAKRKWRRIAIIGITIFSIFALLPSFGAKFPDLWNKIFPENKISLGLDLQGGMHIVLQVETNKLPKGANKDEAVNVVKEILRNRVDEFGVAEPSIQREGLDRIIVQLPGIKEPDRALALIGRTAHLEFRLVDETASADEALKGNVPPDDEIVYERKQNETGKVSSQTFLLKKEAKITGADLVNAAVQIGGQWNEPYVELEFNEEGAKKFAELTGSNVGKKLAIVLDGVIHSAPNIRERIPSGKAQISGSFTMEDAKDLAIVLRAGALPAPVVVAENHMVGPSLGKDSINSGIMACLIGLAFVVVFMVAYYNASGFVAISALILNIIILLGAMAVFRATLTLPGIAGIILTIGMSVDANILIFERIREELRVGKTIYTSIDNGYDRAFSSIFDSNLTTLITAVALYFFGTGPVKGFAVTLSLGIIISMFTAITVTREIYDSILDSGKIKRLSI